MPPTILLRKHTSVPPSGCLLSSSVPGILAGTLPLFSLLFSWNCQAANCGRRLLFTVNFVPGMPDSHGGGWDRKGRQLSCCWTWRHHLYYFACYSVAASTLNGGTFMLKAAVWASSRHPSPACWPGLGMFGRRGWGGTAAALVCLRRQLVASAAGGSCMPSVLVPVSSFSLSPPIFCSLFCAACGRDGLADGAWRRTSMERHDRLVAATSLRVPRAATKEEGAWKGNFRAARACDTPRTLA